MAKSTRGKKYVDGFVLPLPKRNLDEYRKLARRASKIWIDHGALEYRECIGEDMNVHCGLPFPKLVEAKRGEIVVFAWIVYRSRKQRDQVNAKVMADPRLKIDIHNMPFDVSRMTYGGFEILVEAAAV